jgi:hypothetical protein
MTNMKRSKYFKWGVVLMIVCVVAFLAIPVVPFLPLSDGAMVILAGILLVIGEIAFWTGGILLGKELLKKYISRLSPKNWFKRKSDLKDNEPE